MNITRDTIFKAAMFALAVLYLALVSQSVWAANCGNKPEPECGRGNVSGLAAATNQFS
jgi:hypothetical protein